MSWWNNIASYYTAIGEKYRVNPIIFIGIHVVATPLFAAIVYWIIYNKKQQKSLLLPSILAVFVFNAASIYLIIFGKNIPAYIYLIVASSAIISGYFSYRKIKEKVAAIKP